MLKVLEYNSTDTGYEVLVGGPELGRAIAVYVNFMDGLPVCATKEEDPDLADDAIASSMCYLESLGLVTVDPELEMIDEDVKVDMNYQVWILGDNGYEKMISESKDLDEATKSYKDTVDSLKNFKFPENVTKITVQIESVMCYDNYEENIDTIVQHSVDL